MGFKIVFIKNKKGEGIMKDFKIYGQGNMWLTGEVKAANEQEAMMKIDSTMGDLVIDSIRVIIKTIDGKEYELKADEFFIKWQEAEEK
jgi:hypothetical protein